MSEKQDKIFENRLTQTAVAEWITKGKSRQYCMKQLQEQGMSADNASKMYYLALKQITPDPNLMEDYRKGMIQINLDRLENIVDNSIGGNFQSKAVALKAIAESNKMLGIGANGNSVTIAQNKEGEQIINISFD